MIYKIKYKNKTYSIDVIICKNFLQKACGLMFRKKSKPLLFLFNNLTREAIHSFFCKTFIAIWLNDDKIVSIKLIYPWRFYIAPKNKFNRLLEIPEGSKEFLLFLDDNRKI